MIGDLRGGGRVLDMPSPLAGSNDPHDRMTQPSNETTNMRKEQMVFTG